MCHVHITYYRYILHTALRELHLKVDSVSTSECNQLGRMYHGQFQRGYHDSGCELWYLILPLFIASKPPDAVKRAIKVLQNHKLESMERELKGSVIVYR